MKKMKKGFTLIELLIVIAIIGILASIVLVSLSSAREKANIATYKAQISSLQAAMVIECDTAALSNAIVNTAAGSSTNRKAANTFNVTANSCGATGAGTFSVNFNANDLGTSTGANACEGTGTFTEAGVSFPTNC